LSALDLPFGLPFRGVIIHIMYKFPTLSSFLEDDSFFTI